MAKTRVISKKFRKVKTGIDANGKPYKTYTFKIKEDVYNMFKDKLPYEFWNLDYKIFPSGEKRRSKGHNRTQHFSKIITAWEEYFGNLDPQTCAWDGCQETVYITYYGFVRADQGLDKGGYLLNFNTKEVIKTNGNPKKTGYSGPEVPWSEWDHIDSKTKTKEMSAVIRSGGIETIVKEMLLCQLLCLSHHREKTTEELNQIHFNGQGKLSYEQSLSLIKEYIKPISKYHYTPGAKYAHKYGKGALDEAIERAKNTDPALYGDLKRIPRRPDLAYKEEGFKWSDITGNTTGAVRGKKKGGL